VKHLVVARSCTVKYGDCISDRVMFVGLGERMREGSKVFLAIFGGIVRYGVI